MRVIILGGTGFVGKALVRELNKRGYDDVIPTGRMKGDLTSIREAYASIAPLKPDVIFSIAGYVGGIGFNKRQPADMFMNNMKISMNSLEIALALGVKKFIQSGTVCSYPSFAPIPFKEKDLFEGHPEYTNSPYGIARRAAYVMLRSFREQHGFPGIYLIPVNMYGPHDNFDLENSHVIPAMIRKFTDAKKTNEPITLWGDGTPTREFLYVDDCAKAFVDAMEKYDSPEPVNIGSGHEISMKDLAEKISNMVGYEGQIIWDTSKPNGQMRRCLDVSKAIEEFGFKAETTLDEGLKKTIEWYNAQSMS